MKLKFICITATCKAVCYACFVFIIAEESTGISGDGGVNPGTIGVSVGFVILAAILIILLALILYR